MDQAYSYTGPTGEYLELAKLTSGNMNDLASENLCILWTTSAGNSLRIDGSEVKLEKQQLIFLTEFHRIESIKITELKKVVFNRSFYCIKDHDQEVSCKGLLFFGAPMLPIVSIPDEEMETFSLLWRVFTMEMQSKDNLQYEMLQMLLKRLIILCVRLFKEQNNLQAAQPDQTDMIREFNFLVESHFRQQHTVQYYAGLLHKSPKTLSNYFNKHSTATPLQIIHQRILLESRRLLYYSDQPVSEIAYSLGFEDIQTFSRFFKAKEGLAPSEYRQLSEKGRIANPTGKAV